MPEWSCDAGAGRSRMNARPSEIAARRNARSGPRWCRPRGLCGLLSLPASYDRVSWLRNPRWCRLARFADGFGPGPAVEGAAASSCIASLNRSFFRGSRTPGLSPGTTGAVLPFGAQHLAFTTNSYVVHPLFFPGGDMGHLAVNRTVNDLAMCGARPLYLSAGFII